MRIEAEARYVISPGILGAATAMLVLCLAASAAAAEGRGSCATVEVPLPIVLPDGTTHTPEELTLCMIERGPKIGYHEVRLDRMRLKMFQSHVARSEGPAVEHPVFVFQPTRDGRWFLIGYAWPDRDHMRTYALHCIPRGKRMARSGTQEVAALDLFADEDYVLVAANLRRP